MPKAYYNEIDPKAAAWLKKLIAAGHIANGDVDERSIEDVKPSEIEDYTQCHFFAGIGGWSLALRQSGWPDDRQVWTGSCPCQPFSSAGKGLGFDDERHLWPAFFWLIKESGPGIIFGEQVDGEAGETWLDLVVQSDLEGIDYICGAASIAACGFGAPQQRKRLYWVASSNSERRNREHALLREKEGNNFKTPGSCKTGGMACTSGFGQPGKSRGPGKKEHRAAERGLLGWLGDSDKNNGEAITGISQGAGAIAARDRNRPGPTNGYWRDADWLGCRDEKWRAVEPGTFPMAHGLPARVGRLRGYGNAIVIPQAQAFIEAYLECSENLNASDSAQQKHLLPPP